MWEICLLDNPAGIGFHAALGNNVFRGYQELSKKPSRNKPTQPRQVAITTLGCKVNQFESAAFQSDFEAAGLTTVPFTQPADIYVVNTCAVTAKAAAQSRRMIRRAMKLNPKARLVVTGCYAQIASQNILEISDYQVCIVGNGNKHRLPDIALSDIHCDLEMYTGDISRKKEICPLTAHRFGGRTRAYMKIQDGCNAFCSYCIVPYSRGRSHSLSMDKVLEQLDIFVDQGYKEIVLTGIHAGAYGKDFEPAVNLAQLIRKILARRHPVRYRLSSLEPTEISKELLDLLAEEPALAPHLHIPLQSGDNGILKIMNRRYSAEQFAKIVMDCAAALPEAAIGIDVLAGFPGEDEQAFQNTFDLLEKLPATYLHAFPYSKRPGTVAAVLPGQLPNKIKQERVARLRALDHKKRSTHYEKNIGKTRRVLAESSKNQLGLMRGFSENYVPVYFEAGGKYANQFVDVLITKIDDLTVYGEKVSE